MVGMTGIGSLPGTAMAAAVRVAVEDTDQPWLPELPGRGPWASMIGRAAGVLVELPTEFLAGEWRLAANPGRDLRRARATLRDDLDLLEENAQAVAGPFRIAVAGPWTLAAGLLRPRGGRVLGDRSARRDVAASLAAGVAELLAEVHRRLPALELRLQVDEPSLPAVLAGRVPTEGGYFRHRSVEPQEVAETLALFSGLTADALVHCCAAEVPIGLLLGTAGQHGAGFAGLSLDGARLDVSGWDAVGAAVGDGARLYLGLTEGAQPDPGPDALARRALDWLRPLELGEVLADRLWLTHSCGLAGTPSAQVRGQFASLRRAARQVDEVLRG